MINRKYHQRHLVLFIWWMVMKKMSGQL